MGIFLGFMVGIGIVAAGLVHQLSWWVRLRIMPAAVALGAVIAIGITFLGIRSSTEEPFGDIVRAILAAVVVAFLCAGIAQAPSIPALWWAGVLAAFFEGALALLVWAAMLRVFDAGRDQLAAAFGLGPMSPWPAFEAGRTAFLLGLAVLAAGRTIWRLSQRRQGILPG